MGALDTSLSAEISFNAQESILFMCLLGTSSIGLLRGKKRDEGEEGGGVSEWPKKFNNSIHYQTIPSNLMEGVMISKTLIQSNNIQRKRYSQPYRSEILARVTGR